MTYLNVIGEDGDAMHDDACTYLKNIGPSFSDAPLSYDVFALSPKLCCHSSTELKRVVYSGLSVMISVFIVYQV